MRSLPWLIICMLFAGCASPRFVEVTADGGTLAMPSNSNSWPTYYRDKSEKMLKARFPQGYVIEREQEVVIGARSNTTGHTDTQQAPTLLLAGNEEKTSKNGRSSSGILGGVAIPLGETRQTTQESTTTQSLTEWRVYVKKKDASPPTTKLP